MQIYMQYYVGLNAYSMSVLSSYYCLSILFSQTTCYYNDAIFHKFSSSIGYVHSDCAV